MKILLHTLFFSLLAFSISSCDKDDDSNSIGCTKEVTFSVDGTEVCATGTFRITSSTSTFTTINLVGDGGEMLVISVISANATPMQFALGTGNGVYTLADGTQYLSSTGSFNVTDNAETMDATFSFEAATSDNSSSVSITVGVVTDLPKA